MTKRGSGHFWCLAHSGPHEKFSTQMCTLAFRCVLRSVAIAHHCSPNVAESVSGVVVSSLRPSAAALRPSSRMALQQRRSGAVGALAGSGVSVCRVLLQPLCSSSAAMLSCRVAHLRLPRAALSPHVPALAAIQEEPTRGERPQVDRLADRRRISGCCCSEAIFRVRRQQHVVPAR